MKQKQRADQRDDDEFLGKLVREILDGAVDQRGAVIGGDDFHAFRQAGRDLPQPGLHAGDHFARVDAGADDDDPARDLAFAVKFGDAAAHFRTDLDPGDIAQAHRHAIGAEPQRDGVEVLERAQIARSANHVLGFAHFDHGAAGFAIGPAHGVGDAGLADAVSRHSLGIEHDLVLADHAADRGDFGHAGNGLQFKAQEPILQAAQLAQIVATGAIDQCVLINPAHSGRVGAKRRARVRWQAALHLVQIFQHARTRPIKVCPVLKDHIDKGIAEERKAAHGARARHGQHRRGQGISDLVFDDLRRLARIAGAYNHLHIGKIWQRVDWRGAHRQRAGDGQRQRRQHDDDTVCDRPAD